MSTKNITPLRTAKQTAKAKRNEQIRFDYSMLIKIHGSSKMGVYEYLANKYKVSINTVMRCLQ